MTLQDRIGAVINTTAFREYLKASDIPLIEFQANWLHESQGVFWKLPIRYQGAIIAGEAELEYTGSIRVP